MTPGSDLFAQCFAAVSNRAEAELERRGVTLETADQWGRVFFDADDILADAKGTVYKVECRAKDGSDWFRVEAVLNDGGTAVDIVLTTPAKGQK